MKIWHRYLIVLVTLLITSTTAYVYYQYRIAHSSLSDISQVRTTVSGFGDELREVSLLAPADLLAKSMDEHYAFFVHPDLLAAWKANPKIAPGRLTSSPWPDRIDITSTIKNADGTYTVDGKIVERVTSTTTPVRTVPVQFILTKGPDGWQITKYEQVAATTAQ